MPFFNNVLDKVERKRFNELWFVCYSNDPYDSEFIACYDLDERTANLCFDCNWDDINIFNFNTLEGIIFFESEEDTEMSLVDLGYDVDYNTIIRKKENISNFVFVKLPCVGITDEVVSVWVTEETFNKICRNNRIGLLSFVDDYPDYFNERSFDKFLNESKLTEMMPFFHNRPPRYNPNEEFKGTNEEYKRLNKQILHDNSWADKGIPFYLEDVEVEVNDVTITIDQYEFLYDGNRPYSNPLIYDLGEFLNISVNSLKDIIENWEYNEEKFQDFLLDKYREDFEDEARNDTDAVSKAWSEYVDRYSDDDDY